MYVLKDSIHISHLPHNDVGVYCPVNGRYYCSKRYTTSNVYLGRLVYSVQSNFQKILSFIFRVRYFKQGNRLVDDSLREEL